MKISSKFSSETVSLTGELTGGLLEGAMSGMYEGHVCCPVQMCHYGVSIAVTRRRPLFV